MGPVSVPSLLHFNRLCASSAKELAGPSWAGSNTCTKTDRVCVTGCAYCLLPSQLKHRNPQPLLLAQSNPTPRAAKNPREVLGHVQPLHRELSERNRMLRRVAPSGHQTLPKASVT